MRGNKMKTRLKLFILAFICLLLTACGSAESEASEGAYVVTEDQAVAAIKNYCYINFPEVKEKEGSDDYTVYWDVSTNEDNEIVVLFRSYTGAEMRYYINPASGETYVTELVPGIIDEEQRTEESFNVKDYFPD